MKSKKMTMDEFDKLTPQAQEAILGKATRAEIARHHAAGHPTGHGDEKEFISCIRTVARYTQSVTMRRTR